MGLRPTPRRLQGPRLRFAGLRDLDLAQARVENETKVKGKEEAGGPQDR